MQTEAWAAVKGVIVHMAYNGIYVNFGRNEKRPEALNVALYSAGGGVHYANFLGYVSRRRNSVKLYPQGWVEGAFYKVHEISLFDLKSEDTWKRIRERNSEKHEKGNMYGN